MSLIDDFPMFFAILCGMASSFLLALGLIFMKMATIAVELNIDKVPYFEWQYLVGVLLCFAAAYFTGKALELGNIILNSFSPCFTITFTIILSTLVLKERFIWKVDGVSIFIICTGCLIAILQQPFDLQSPYTKDNVTELVVQRVTQAKSIAYYGIVISIYGARHFLH